VAVIIKRVDKSAIVGPATKRVAAGGSDFLLARLLHCPTCGTSLTGTRDRDGTRVRYSCRLGSVTPHTRVSVSEHLILPAIRAEVARLRPPNARYTDKAPDPERAKLDAERTRVIDLYQSGDIDKSEKTRRLVRIGEREAKLQARAVVLRAPAFDWTWPVREVNAVLRAIFERIDLDPLTFQPRPDGFAWYVPEWRA
jgi:hypothetical protein